jgi:hypothetical protein
MGSLLYNKYKLGVDLAVRVMRSSSPLEKSHRRSNTVDNTLFRATMKAHLFLSC